jgi:hypothetical protein
MIGAPVFATSPAATPQIANTEPTEMSMLPVRITRVAPSATISTGMLPRKRSLRLSRAKYPGAAAASVNASAPITRARETSLR